MAKTPSPAKPIVLIVDDDPGIRRVMRRLIERHYIAKVIEAGDGFTALDQFALMNVSLVITDCVMPGLDGFELTIRLRGQRSFDALPIIFCSGRSGAAGRAAAAEAGSTSFLAKPFEPVDLYERLDPYLSKSSSAARRRA